ncbi:glycosyltransferase family 4 protein [Thiobacillus sp.]|uniref:glycosyltransferase family 4 protein n=1 Tax=Thiobacillus sp. TaxID=924 RepID=UPI0017E76723|nr:glycosyltransferase family 4 protein [Thiobacillus sp.]MBC2729369.1 glycosyltransferase family 4 protein [Thiobacillus sp.]MBC2738104.1 glycosyltransferase family 4 protein [Thiobacillus sp.]MBC2759695.1 glycosyltransferase family 4 protein [Thiobacillus sp.]
MPLKVTHVVRQYYPSIGGMEDVVQSIAQHQMKRHGQLPVIVTLDRLFRNADQPLAGEETINGIQVVRLPYRGTSRYPLCPGVLDHVRDTDVIHVHGIDFFFDFLAAMRPIHRRPMVASTHGGFFHTRFASTLKKVYFNTATRLSSVAYDRVVATSENDGRIFNAIVQSPKKIVIENGVNVEKYADRSACELAPTLIYFGRWSENKGLLETIEFFRQLVARQPAWKLIIAGREYDHTQAALADRIRQHGLVDSVRLAANPSDQELASLIGQSSYFICLSHHEGFGIAPIEAMSAGLTPVLSDIPPFRNLIQQVGQGLLLDTRQLESGVNSLLTLHEQGEHDYLNRREFVRTSVERYSWKYVADQYVDIYRSLVDPSLRKAICR